MLNYRTCPSPLRQRMRESMREGDDGRDDRLRCYGCVLALGNATSMTEETNKQLEGTRAVSWHG